MTTLPDIILTSMDYERLSGLVSTLPDTHPVKKLLEDELDRAEVVEPHEVPADVVTMNSKVVVEEETGEQHVVSLVWPGAANFEAGRLSVLAPVGAALLGLRAGQSIDWPMPNGRRKRVRVVRVEWQPEASGDSNL